MEKPLCFFISPLRKLGLVRNKKSKIIIAAAVIILLAGCANPGIVPISGQTYMLSRTDKGGIFGNSAAMKADVLREASEFAESKGKTAIPVSLEEAPLLVGRQFASITYQFRLVDKDDPAAQNTVLKRGPNTITENREKITIDMRTQDGTPKGRDVYGELLKLDDLLKRGILTQAEFDTQKKALLEGR